MESVRRYGEKNRPIQSDGWGKGADKGAIVRQIFIRSLEILHCAKIEGLRVAGIAEVEKRRNGFLGPKTKRVGLSTVWCSFEGKALLTPHLSICKCYVLSELNQTDTV